MKCLKAILIFAVIILFNGRSFASVNTDSLEQKVTMVDDSTAYWVLFELYNNYFYSEPTKARQRIEQALQLARKYSWTLNEINALMSIGVLEFNYGQADSAILLYREALQIWHQKPDSLFLARIYGNLGNAYMTINKYDSAITYFKKTGELFEKLNNQKGIAKVYGVLGNLNLTLENQRTAKEYYMKALKLNLELGNKEDAATSKLNLAIILRNEGELQQAIAYNQEVAIYYHQTKNPYYEGMSLSNLGNCYQLMGKPDKALIQFKQAVNKFMEVDQTKAVAKTYGDMADIYTDLNHYDLAINYYKKSLAYLKDDSSIETRKKILNNLYEAYKKMNNSQEALNYLEQFHLLSDSLAKVTRQSKIDSLLTQFETEKKEKEISLLQTKSELQAQKIHQQKNMKIFLSILVLMLVVLVLVVYSRVRFKQKKNEELSAMNRQIKVQNEEISAQRDEIEAQRDHIARQSASMMSSINYAASIQKAVMPSFEGFFQLFPDSFILFMPRDVVSGDFFWYYRTNSKRIIAAVDCTGHGVPGAFLSLLGITFLNEITSVMGITQPHKILNKLREMVINALQQESDKLGSKDGMELSVCVIDDVSHKIEYSGAHQDIFMVRRNNLEVFKANKMPVGTYFKEDLFTSEKITFEPSDLLYLFTDGYMDQTGGPEGNKFMLAPFKALINEHCSEPMSKQQELLLKNFEAWKSTQEQIDDVLVIGIRL